MGDLVRLDTRWVPATSRELGTAAERRFVEFCRSINVSVTPSQSASGLEEPLLTPMRSAERSGVGASELRKTEKLRDLGAEVFANFSGRLKAGTDPCRRVGLFSQAH